MELTVETPIADRPRHAIGCGIQHDCRDNDCANGALLRSNKYATQDAEKPWWIHVPMSDDDIIEMQQRALDLAVKAEAEAAAAEARSKLKASAISKLVAGQPLTEDEAALLVIA